MEHLDTTSQSNESILVSFEVSLYRSSFTRIIIPSLSLVRHPYRKRLEDNKLIIRLFLSISFTKKVKKTLNCCEDFSKLIQKYIFHLLVGTTNWVLFYSQTKRQTSVWDPIFITLKFWRIDGSIFDVYMRQVASN